MVVGECNVKPARRNVGRALQFPAQARHFWTMSPVCHLHAHEHHCKEFLYILSIGMCTIRHTTTSTITITSYHPDSCAPGGYLLCLTISPCHSFASGWQTRTTSSAHPPSRSTAGGVILFPRGGRFTRAKMPTFLSLMKLIITIGHEGCAGIVS